MASAWCFTKSGRGERRWRVRREAAVLRSMAGLPVVRLLDSADDGVTAELRTLRAGGTSAADSTVGRRARLAAVARGCEALAALHQAGWAHGRPTLDHLVVGAEGRVAWCSLGGAVSLAADPAATERDRRVLARAAADLAAELGSKRTRRRIVDLGDAPALEHLARTVRPAHGVTASVRPMAVSAAVVLLVLGLGSGADTARVGSAPSDLDDPNAQIPIAADPSCRESGVRLLLNPSTGEVLRSSRGAERSPVLVARVPGAVRWAHGATCSNPLVERDDGITVEVPGA